MALVRIVFLTALFSAVIVSCYALPSSRILESKEAGPEQFPYAASVRVNGAHACGGSIIASRFILTAGHCVSEPVLARDVSVRVGSTNQYAAGDIHNVDKIFLHGNYGNFMDNIAVLRLAKPVKESRRVSIIPLATSEEDAPVGSKAVVAGWGQTVSETNYKPHKLQYSSFEMTDASTCDKLIGYGYPSTICMIHEEKKGTCIGDAGSGAVFNKKLVGVSSFVIGACGTKFPDVFSNVSYYVDWIESIIA